MSLSRLHSHADAAGAATSTLCLLHCLLTPLLVSASPGMLAYLPSDAPFHRELTGAILLFGIAGFLPGYRLHRRKPLLALIAGGIALIGVVAWHGDGLSTVMEFGFSVTGSLLLVAAHLLNRSFCRQCRTCRDTEVHCQTTHIS